MLQRIQSIFLALASFCCFGLFATDTAETDTPVAGSKLFADAQFTLFDDPVLLGVFGLAGLILLVAIFLFRNRPLQMSLSLLAVLLVVAGAAYGGYLVSGDTGAAAAEVEPGVALPILAVIFGALARSYVQKDEKLVRSADRLR